MGWNLLSVPSYTLFWLHLPSSSCPLICFYGGTMVSFSSQHALSVQLSLSCSFSPHHPQPLSILGMQISDHKVWSLGWRGANNYGKENRTQREWGKRDRRKGRCRDQGGGGNKEIRNTEVKSPFHIFDMCSKGAICKMPMTPGLLNTDATNQKPQTEFQIWLEWNIFAPDQIHKSLWIYRRLTT